MYRDGYDDDGDDDKTHKLNDTCYHFALCTLCASNPDDTGNRAKPNKYDPTLREE